MPPVTLAREPGDCGKRKGILGCHEDISLKSDPLEGSQLGKTMQDPTPDKSNPY